MHEVSLSPIYQVFNEALLTFLSGLAIWLAAYGKQWLTAHAKFLGEQTDAQLAAGLNRALSNGVQIALQQADKIEKENPGIESKSAITAFAAQYAINHSPAAMAKFGLDPNDLALKALAYLPSPSEHLADGTPAPAKVQVQTLPPVS
jgi:hypothetical protein